MEVEKESKVSAVVRTMTILESLATKAPLSISEVSRNTGIHKSTVFRFLTTLCSLEYVYRLPESDQYALSGKMEVFKNQPRVERLLDLAMPFLEKLSQTTKETVHLAVLREDKLSYLHKIDSTQTLRVVTASHPGGAGPLYCTGLGKAMLAWMDDTKKKAYLDRIVYQRFTPSTINDSESLLDELAKIRAKGYAIDNGEHEDGVICIAAPLRKGGKDPIAAISIAGPAARMENNMSYYTVQVLEQAKEIERLLP